MDISIARRSTELLVHVIACAGQELVLDIILIRTPPHVAVAMGERPNAESLLVPSGETSTATCVH